MCGTGNGCLTDLWEACQSVVSSLLLTRKYYWFAYAAQTQATLQE